MENHLKNIFLAVFIFVSMPVFSQTKNEKQKVVATYNINKLMQLKNQFDIKFKENQIKIKLLAQQNNWILKKTENGNLIELIDVDENDNPIYYTTYNINAAISTRTNTLHNNGLLGLNLEGQNMTAYIWDGGVARITHQEYDGIGGNNRYSVGDGSSEINAHGSHVTGTIISSGVQANAKGMAPQANAIGYDWNNDVNEALTEASNGMLISNHSYGIEASTLNDRYFGYYSYKSWQWDQIMYNAPFYLMIVSAGNDGLDNVSNGDPLEGNSNYDKLSEAKTAKNNLVVANAQDANIDSNGNLISVQIHPTSSQGPTDDLRIKPDITGNGTQLYSTIDALDNAYDTKTGTSMSASNVTGTLLLLQQHYNNINSNFMKASTLKGLVLHTADDAGSIGPDAIYGWGLLNAKKAVNTITNNGATTLIKELTLHQGQTYKFTVDADGVNDLIASISWTDPERISYLNGTNNSTPVLVNDLDIRITQNNDVFEPFLLTSVNTNATGDNIVDPYEKVIVNGASGSYNIIITHKGELNNNVQNFSLIVTGKLENNTCMAEVPSNINIFDVNNNDVTIAWNTVNNANYTYRYRKLGDVDWTEESTNLIDVNLTNLTVDTDYEFQVKSVCSDSSSAFSPVFNFRTNSIGYCPDIVDVGYFDDFENETIPEVDSCWTIIAEGDSNNYVRSYTNNDNTYIKIKDQYSESVYFISPFLNDLDTSKRISFKTDKSIVVGVMSDPNNQNTFMPLEELNDYYFYYAKFKEIHIDLVDKDLSGNYIVFKKSSPSFRFKIDDFSYEDSPSCIEPKHLNKINETATTLSFNWTQETSVNEWIIEYGPQDFELGTGSQVTVNTTQCELTNLETNQDYDIYIKAVCNLTEQSEWSRIQLKTKCGITAPHEISFDEDGYCDYLGYLDTCWYGNKNVYNESDSAQDYCLILKQEKSILPELIDFDNNKRITFSIRTSYTTSDETIFIGTMSDPTDETTFHLYYTIPPEKLGYFYKYQIVDFKDYNGTDKFIAIYNSSNNYYYSAYIDDITYEETPSCLEVDNITTNVVSESEIEVSWDEIGTASEWEIEYGLYGFTQGSGTIVSSTNTSITINNLENGTYYDFYVRSVCSSVDKSNWLPYPARCQTICGSKNIGYLETFNEPFLSQIEEKCWRQMDNSGISLISDSIEQIGKSVSFYTSSNSTMFSPVLENLNSGNKKLKFWLKKQNYYQNDYNGNGFILQVGTTSLNSDLSDFNILQTYDFNDIDYEWKLFTIDVDMNIEEDNRIVFHTEGANNSNYRRLQFDRFEYTEISSCDRPTNIILNNLSNSNLTISWEENGNANQWEITYSQDYDFLTDGTTITTNSNPFTFIGLENDTRYNIWIRSICDDGTTSDYSDKLTIETGCGDSFDVDYTENFDTSIDCWTMYPSSPSTYLSCELYLHDNDNNDYGVQLISKTDRSAILTSPYLRNLDTDKKISFDLKRFEGYVHVGTMTDPSDISTFHDLATFFGNNSNQWETKTVYLNEFEHFEDHYIAFKAAKYTHGYNLDDINVLVDNFEYLQSVNCNPIQGINVTNIDESTVEVSWDNPNAIEYVYECTANNFNSITTTSNINTIDGLIGNTTYNIRVKAKCDTNLFSDWSEYFSFTTICDDKVAPYFDSFEFDDYRLHPCWSIISSNNYNTVRIEHEIPYLNILPVSGQNFISINNSHFHLVTPTLQDLDNNKRIRFYGMIETGSIQNGENTSLKIGTMSDLTDESTFNLIKTLEFESINNLSYTKNIDDPQWKEFTIYLNNSTITGQNIVFKNDNFDGETIFYIDDFHYEEIPNCTEPLYATTSNITYESADVTWESYENSNPVSWEIEYGIENFVQGEGTVVNVTQNSYSFTNLLDDTYYEYYIRANCGGGQNSNWSTKFRFKTPCIGVEVGYSENFDSYDVGSIKGCWTGIFPWVGNNYWDYNNYVVVTDNMNESYSGPNSIRLFNETHHTVFHNDIYERILLVSPRLIDFNNYKKISFWMKSDTHNAKLEIGTLSDPNDYATFTYFQTVEFTQDDLNTWEKYEIDFSNYYGTDMYIGFRQSAENGRHKIFIDDFEYLEKECNKPTNLFAYQTSTDEITLEWDDNNTNSPPESWEIDYGLSSEPQGYYNRNIITANSNPYTISGVSLQEISNFYVRANCNENSVSDWSDPYEFYLSCASNSPLTENFDNLDIDTNYIYGNNGYCWLITNNLETRISSWDYSTYPLTNSAPNFLTLVNNTNFDLSPNPGMFVSPYLDDLDANKILKVWIKKRKSYSESGLIIGTIKNPIDRSTFTPFIHITGNEISENGSEHIIDFSNYTGNDNFIAFLHDGTQEYENLRIDDINYLDSDDCLPPYNITISNTTSTSTQINWESLYNFQNFEIEYGLAGFIQGNGTTQLTSTTEINLNSLFSNTDYEFYLKTNCDNDTSLWEGPYQFHTNSIPTELPWFEGFEELSTLGFGLNNFPANFYVNQYMFSTNEVHTDETYDQQYPMWPYEGNNFVAGNISHKLWLITPNFELDANQTYFFNFMHLIEDQPYGNSDDRKHIHIYAIKGHNLSENKILLNRVRSWFNSYDLTYDTVIQSFTPEISGEYSFAIYYDANTDNLMANNFSLDNLSVNSIIEDTVQNENIEDFQDMNFSNIGITNGTNSTSYINEELMFTSISSQNWVQTRNTLSNWENNSSYISTLKMEVDATTSPLVTLKFKLKQKYFENINESQFRVLINGSQFGNIYLPTSHNDSYQDISLDLAAYNGQVYTIELQFIGKNNQNEITSYGTGDEAYIDDVSIQLNNSLAVEDASFNNLIFYPNPTTGKVYLKSDKKIHKIEVFNLLGQSLLSKEYDTNNVILDLEKFDGSVYLLHIYIENSKKILKIMRK